MKKLWLGNSGEPICTTQFAQMLATNLSFPPDPDDSWQMSSGATTSSPPQEQKLTSHISDASGGYKIIWENPGATGKNLDASLRFKLLSPDNRPAPIEPYMGMAGHAVVRRQDGTVFAHLHPIGTFSMAAQEFFVTGKPLKKSGLQLQPTELHSNHTNGVIAIGDVSFPYAFPQPGAYRLWIQMKSEGRILTGVFDTTVATAD